MLSTLPTSSPRISPLSTPGALTHVRFVLKNHYFQEPYLKKVTSLRGLKMSFMFETVSEIVEKVFNPPPLNLEEYCLIKVITLICNHPDVNRLLKDCYCDMHYFDRMELIKTEEWISVQIKVTELISNLGISQGLQEKILDRLWPVASRKLMWMVKYVEFITIEGWQDIIWTDRGKINRPKTAKSIIKNKRVCILQRFDLSLYYCRIAESLKLWKEMSFKQKASIYKNKVYPIDDFMLSIVNGTCDEEEYYREAIKSALEMGYLELVKCLFRILPEENKKDEPIQFLEVLSNQLESETFLEEEHIDVCFFLLNQMDDETKTLCFVKYPMLVLCFFLEYPDVSCFMAYFQQALINGMTISNGYAFFKFIFYKFHLGEVNYDKYRLLFFEVWRIIPSNIRKYLKRTDLGPFCGSKIIKQQFPFLLREGGYFEMEKFISGKINPRTAGSSLQFDLRKWQFLKTLMEEKLITLRNMKRHNILLGIEESNVVAWREVKRLHRRISKFKH